MRILYRVASFLRALFRNRRVDEDFAEEVQFHVDRETQANIARGMSPGAAHRAARLAFGSVEAARETSRDARPGAMVRQAVRDMRFGARLLAKSPAFGVAGIAIIALGIGAVTAIFSVVYGVMLRPLPYREPERLVSVWSRLLTQPNADHLYPGAADFYEWKRSNRVFTDMALVKYSTSLNLGGDGEPERLVGARVTTNVFSVLGASVARGRTFTAEEAQPGHEQVVILSDALWRRRFGSDPSVLGRRIQLNAAPYTVIGVMPPDFEYPTHDYQAWIPLIVEASELTRQTNQNYLVVARLESTATLEQARVDMEGVATRLAAASPQSNRDVRVTIEPMLADAVRGVRPTLVVLLGAVMCLLLIACLNLSNLLGARAAARSGEFAVRLALGASRGRLLAQAVAEVAPVLFIGGTLGVLAATWGVRAFVAAAPSGVPRLESVAVDGAVIFVSLLVLVATGLAASLAPAISAWRSDFTTITKDRSRSSTAGRGRSRTRRLGVAAQIAFAVPLLVGASLLIRSSLQLADVDLGFRHSGIATFHIAVPRTKYREARDVADFYGRIVGAARALPGVSHAGMVNRLPLAGNQTNPVSAIDGSGATVHLDAIDSRTVTPDYFATMGIALRGGRVFTDRDDMDAPPVAIVDDRLASTMWPGQSALGKRLRLRFGDGRWNEVVGVVSHIRTSAVDVDPRPQVYWSYRQFVQDRMALVVQTSGDAQTLMTPVIQAIHTVDPEQPAYDVRTMDAVVERSLVQRRLTMILIVAFGGIALLLAAVGVYGVVAFGVTQRIREFGIRTALGATSADVVGLVVRDGTSMAVLGAVIGLATAFSVMRFMSNLVYGVGVRDVASFVAATGALVLVAALASYLPARRASSVDPASTLRSE